MRASRAKGRDRGAAAIEMALVLPLLLLVLGGIIDFGRLFGAQMTITQASREGARIKALGLSDSDMNTRVGAAANGMAVSATTVTACPNQPALTDAAVVRVSHVFDFIVLDSVINLFGGGWASGITLTSTGSMRCTG
jgi:Flp pilus assembly protein TadG